MSEIGTDHEVDGRPAEAISCVGNNPHTQRPCTHHDVNSSGDDSVIFLAVSRVSSGVIVRRSPKKECVEIDLESSEYSATNPGHTSGHTHVDDTSQITPQKSGNSYRNGRQYACQAKNKSVSSTPSTQSLEQQKIGQDDDGKNETFVRSRTNGETSNRQQRCPLGKSMLITSENFKSRDSTLHAEDNDSITAPEPDLDDMSDIAATLESLKDRNDSPTPTRPRRSPRIKAHEYEFETSCLSDFDLRVPCKTMRKKKANKDIEMDSENERDADEEFQAGHDIEMDSGAGSTRKSRRRVVPSWRYEPVEKVGLQAARTSSKKRLKHDESSTKRHSIVDDSDDSSFDENAVEKDSSMDDSSSDSSFTAPSEDASEEEKKEHIEKERKLRQKYLSEIAALRENTEKESNEQRKSREDIAKKTAAARVSTKKKCKQHDAADSDDKDKDTTQKGPGSYSGYYLHHHTNFSPAWLSLGPYALQYPPPYLPPSYNHPAWPSRDPFATQYPPPYPLLSSYHPASLPLSSYHPASLQHPPAEHNAQAPRPESEISQYRYSEYLSYAQAGYGPYPPTGSSRGVSGWWI